MKVSYVRVSKQEQYYETLQIDIPKETGCEKWFLDKITGSKAERKGLSEALACATRERILRILTPDELTFKMRFRFRSQLIRSQLKRSYPLMHKSHLILKFTNGTLKAMHQPWIFTANKVRRWTCTEVKFPGPLNIISTQTCSTSLVVRANQVMFDRGVDNTVCYGCAL